MQGTVLFQIVCAVTRAFDISDDSRWIGLRHASILGP